jgi:hypothetical protein
MSEAGPVEVPAHTAGPSTHAATVASWGQPGLDGSDEDEPGVAGGDPLQTAGAVARTRNRGPAFTTVLVAALLKRVAHTRTNRSLVAASKLCAAGAVFFKVKCSVSNLSKAGWAWHVQQGGGGGVEILKVPHETGGENKKARAAYMDAELVTPVEVEQFLLTLSQHPAKLHPAVLALVNAARLPQAPPSRKAHRGTRRPPLEPPQPPPPGRQTVPWRGWSRRTRRSARSS